MKLPLDNRPVIVALTGPNGGGKTTFYQAHLAPVGLRFINADVFARELPLDPYSAAIRELPHVLLFDNDDLRTPFREVAQFRKGQRLSLRPPVPKWLKPLLSPQAPD